MRRLILLLAVTAVLAGGALVQFSGASFNSESSSTISVTADRIQNWLSLYSQSTDPDGLTGYFTRLPAGVPAATGMNGTLTVDLGEVKMNPPTKANRVFTIKTPGVFPTGTSVTVTATALDDPSRPGKPVLIPIGFADVGVSDTYTNPITLGVNQKRQLNLVIDCQGKGIQWYPTILITVTYPGFTGTYYRYTVPVTVYSY
ncbi:MAG: hypothetical protein ABIG68_09885 [Acidobacteriota bacterium]